MENRIALSPIKTYKHRYSGARSKKIRNEVEKLNGKAYDEVMKLMEEIAEREQIMLKKLGIYLRLQEKKHGMTRKGTPKLERAVAIHYEGYEI